MSDASDNLGTPTVHVCETVPLTRQTPLLHVVLPPPQPGGTPLANLTDTGYRIVSYGVSPEEVPECPKGDSYPGCEHFLVERVRNHP